MGKLVLRPCIPSYYGQIHESWLDWVSLLCGVALVALLVLPSIVVMLRSL